MIRLFSVCSSCFFVMFVPWVFAVVLIRLLVMFGSLVMMVSMVFSIGVRGVFVVGIIVFHPHLVLSLVCECCSLFCFFYLKFDVLFVM